MKIDIYNAFNILGTIEKTELVDFLYKHLDEYGDKWEDIERAVNYAIDPNPAFGGFVISLKEDGEIKGVVVINKTRMKGYIPENILVYIAVHQDARGQGLGKKLMQKVIKTSKGDIALHVEPDNPARFLYKSVGFENPYLEMRYYKNPKASKSKPRIEN